MAGTPGRDPWGIPGICYLFGSLLAGLLFPGAAAFNLDVMGALRKEGEPGSLFAFSFLETRRLLPAQGRQRAIMGASEGLPEGADSRRGSNQSILKMGFYPGRCWGGGRGVKGQRGGRLGGPLKDQRDSETRDPPREI